MPPDARWPGAREGVTVTLAAAARGKSTGSETACAPAGTATPGRPAKVTARDVPGSIELTPARPPPRPPRANAGDAQSRAAEGVAEPQPDALRARRHPDRLP